MDDAARLEVMIDHYTPEIAEAGREALGKLRELAPGAFEMVYDNWNGLVVGFGPNERPMQAIFSLLFVPRWLTLCFLFGKTLDDPHGLLKGDGTQVRSVRLIPPVTLDDPRVTDLIAHAIKARGGWDFRRPSTLIIKSVSAKQRPRRP